MTSKNSQNQIIISTLYDKIQKHSFKKFLSEYTGHLHLVKN